MHSGALSQQQVDGYSVLLGLWDWQATGTPMTDIRWLAYLLATVYHECAQKMWPVTEYGNDEYLQSREYWPYIGRGFVQLTWESNYARASSILGLIDDRDLVQHPDTALDSLIAARCLFRGCAEGWWTDGAHKLGDYFNEDEDDPVNARRIVNGTDQAELIAEHYAQYLDALEAAYHKWPRTPV
jgi:predicted chitinase